MRYPNKLIAGREGCSDLKHSSEDLRQTVQDSIRNLDPVGIVVLYTDKTSTNITPKSHLFEGYGPNESNCTCMSAHGVEHCQK